jgi:hypothetical protein
MKHSRRRENILRRWAWGVRWCSKLWVGLWVEVFGATPRNLLKRMVGLGGLEPPTSPLSGARSSHLSYRPFEVTRKSSMRAGEVPLHGAKSSRFLLTASHQRHQDYWTKPTLGGVLPSGTSLMGPNCAS